MNACSEYMNLHVFTIVNTIVLLGYTDRLYNTLNTVLLVLNYTSYCEEARTISQWQASSPVKAAQVQKRARPEADAFPKQLLHVTSTPPIWAEVRMVGCGCPNQVGNSMLSSHDMKCPSPLTPLGVFKAVFITYAI